MWLDKFKKPENYRGFKKEPVAYFCAEYALFDHTPLYAGGLGILAGDYVKEMAKQNMPAVAIGLYYHKEHEHGLDLNRDRKTPLDLGLNLVTDSNGSVVKIPILLGDKNVHVQAWYWKKNELTLYLLDTQVEENDKDDWDICDYLYVEDRGTRLRQEIILGIAGVRLLNTLNIHPSVFHMNEGHSAFLAFELIRHEMTRRKVDFKTAIQFAKKHIVFTNHTLVPAGHELFNIDTIKSIASGFAKDLGIDINELVSLGLNKEFNMFSMTELALNLSSKVNAVSKLHGVKAKEEWKGYNVESITNGIYIEDWDILRHYSHKEQKNKLVELVNAKCGVNFDVDTITLGWARRFVDYKRPLAILGNVAKLKELGKVQIIFSSAINSTYSEENEYYKEIIKLSNNELKGLIAVIPDYNIEVTKLMTSGCDIWLNTPIVGREACGTSGMKGCLNGALPLSTSDGWIDEVDLNGIGWKVEDGDNITDNLLNILGSEIMPEYYNNKDGWNNRIKKSRELILNNFGMNRVLKEYISKLYIPTYNNRKHP